MSEQDPALIDQLRQLEFVVAQAVPVGALAIGVAVSMQYMPCPIVVETVVVTAPGKGRYAEDGEARRSRHLATEEYTVAASRGMWEAYSAALAAGEFVIIDQQLDALGVPRSKAD